MFRLKIYGHILVTVRASSSHTHTHTPARSISNSDCWCLMRMEDKINVVVKQFVRQYEVVIVVVVF